MQSFEQIVRTTEVFRKQDEDTMLPSFVKIKVHIQRNTKQAIRYVKLKRIAKQFIDRL